MCSDERCVSDLSDAGSAGNNITSFYGSFCANNGKDALNTPGSVGISVRWTSPTSSVSSSMSPRQERVCLRRLVSPLTGHAAHHGEGIPGACINPNLHARCDARRVSQQP
eukprot:9202785-Pyramimonas_sp.AAC.1